MKVVIIGAAGGIGQPLALLLKTQLPPNSKLSLYDIVPEIMGITADLNHIPTSIDVNGYFGKNLSLALKDANIVLIVAGLSRKPGMDRSDLFSSNANIIVDIMHHIACTCHKTFICIITNPVNSIVVIAAEIMKKYGVYDKRKLFGITTLDLIRSQTFVAKLKDKKVSSVIPVIGGHSSSTILPLLSQVTNFSFSKQEIIFLTKQIQNAGNEVVKAKDGKGSATLSMSYAAACFCNSLVRASCGEQNIIEFAYVEGDGQYARFFAQPVRLGPDGIQDYMSIGTLSNYEYKLLEDIMDQLRKDIVIGEEFASNK